MEIIFLTQPEVFCRQFMQPGMHGADVLDMFSDASRNFKLGFGGYCRSEWTFGQWDEEFCLNKQPSIEYLKLFAVTVAVVNWLKLFRNRRIVLFCDNEAVVSMINNSKCKNCMVLVRIIILEGLLCNTRVYARYVRSKDNVKADALSRLQMDRCWLAASNDHMNAMPSKIPDLLWPMEKIWLD